MGITDSAEISGSNGRPKFCTRPLALSWSPTTICLTVYRVSRITGSNGPTTSDVNGKKLFRRPRMKSRSPEVRSVL